MEFPGFSHAALWTRPGAPFLCLEAWTGYSDPEDFAGELSDKPSMRVLGARRTRPPRGALRLSGGLRRCKGTMAMTKAFVLDGKAIAEGVIGKVAAETRALAQRGVTPGLAVVLVGEDPASQSYVAGKGRAAKSLRLSFGAAHLARRRRAKPTCSRSSQALNADPAIHGILVQLPLPEACPLGARARSDRPEEGRRRLSSDQCRPALDRRDRPRARALHAGRRDDHARQGLRGARARRSPARRRSSSAARTSSASRWRSCCSRATAR